jgi:Ca-activated chloride channel homolog
MKTKIILISFSILITLLFMHCSNGNMSREGAYEYMNTTTQGKYLNPSTESYRKITENDFLTVKSNPLSTFSIDVDKASYSNIRRFINEGQEPPADAVRIEEMINYFTYDYPQPTGDAPVSITTEISGCPWNPEDQLIMIGLQGKRIDPEKLPPSNLVFLIDVSGSMGEPNKLPLLQSSFKLLVENLREQDRVSIVSYAGAAGLVLPSTSGDKKEEIFRALDHMESGGSTAGSEGIELAYKIAGENFIKGGNNRVILATDGDFNVGPSNDNEMEELITSKRKTGIYLTCLGFGMGNYKDSKIKTLSEKGNGNYAYIDSFQEAKKTLLSEFGGTLFTIAKDVKIQVEFNPTKIQAYRLIGYENRVMNNEDFKDDAKDAGEMGSGHTVSALYEIVPVGVKSKYVRATGDLKYQDQKTNSTAENTVEFASVKVRYKNPEDTVSKELVQAVTLQNPYFSKASDNMRFASSVALAGMLMRDSKFSGIGTGKSVIEIAKTSLGKDEEGYRSEFIRLLQTYEGIKKGSE